MLSVQIHHLAIVQGYILLVFRTEAQGWQFRVANLTGEVFGMELPYDAADAAGRVGRNWIDARCR